jgi:hypothetical protein
LRTRKAVRLHRAAPFGIPSVIATFVFLFSFHLLANWK